MPVQHVHDCFGADIIYRCTDPIAQPQVVEPGSISEPCLNELPAGTNCLGLMGTYNTRISHMSDFLEQRVLIQLTYKSAKDVH
jgi:hypothetical protein